MKNIAARPPDWLAENAIYQINPRTFTKDGTIASIIDELDFLKSLGFNIIYLCPIFCEDDSTDKSNWSARQLKSETENPKNPYRMNDYFFIDSEYGTIEDLKKLVDEAHRLDMKILLDLVYAHIGPNAPIIKRHPEFVQQTEDGEIINTEWNFPSLDFTCAGLREYLYCNMSYYIGVIDADGFRCDVGDAVPEDFWLEARQRIRRIKNDAVLINEGRNYKKLKSSFDASYCFPWHEALYKVYTENEKASYMLFTDCEAREILPKGGLLLRDIDNHDTVTDWVERTEKAVGSDGMELIEVLNYIIDGIPMVYCGNELACDAKLSMFANRFYPGIYETTDRSRAQKSKPAAVRRQKIFKMLNKLKAENSILKYGDTIWLENSNPDSILSLMRIRKGEAMVFIGNTSKEIRSGKIKELPETAEILFSNGIINHDCDSFTFNGSGYAVLKF